MQTIGQLREAAAENHRRDPLIGMRDADLNYYAAMYIQRGYQPDVVTFETFLRIALDIRSVRVKRW